MGRPYTVECAGPTTVNTGVFARTQSPESDQSAFTYRLSQLRSPVSRTSVHQVGVPDLRLSLTVASTTGTTNPHNHGKLACPPPAEIGYPDNGLDRNTGKLRA